MKRRLTKLVVFLLLGAIVNVAVAWGCAIWSPVKTTRPLEDDFGMSMLRSHGLDPYNPQNPGKSAVGLGLRWRTSSAGYDRGWSGDGPYNSFIYSLDAGCPMLCMTGGMRSEYRPGSVAMDYFSLIDPRSVLGSVSNRGFDLLPLRPIWPGFAINTIFYAAILWMLTLGPFTARRVIRRKRGRCIKCGYDLRGSSGGGGVCPECGLGREVVEAV